jgi:predicted metal-dependent peptidase
MSDPCLARYRKARTILLLNHPFFGALSFRLKPVCAPRVETMATDGISLFYNPDFLMSLNIEELVGCLAHEVMHPALGHHTRRGGRNPERWNEAADYAINPIILNAGMILPAGILNDYRYHGKSAEEIYNLLQAAEEEEKKRQEEQKQQDKNSNNDNSDKGQSDQSDKVTNGSGTPAQDDDSLPERDQQSSPGNSDSGKGKNKDAGSKGDGKEAGDGPCAPQSRGGIGQVIDAPSQETPGVPMSGAERDALESAWRCAVQQATAVSRSAGKYPAGVEVAVERADDAAVDWRDRFRQAYASCIPINYSWARPNRRYVHSGLFLPGPVKEGVGELVVGIDCSASITPRVLGQFEAELNSLIEEHRPETVHVIYFDAIVQKHDILRDQQSVEIDPKGGGGTKFEPVFVYIEEQGIQPQCTIMLTDLEGSFPEELPQSPVLWCSILEGEAPFGEVIPISHI